MRERFPDRPDPVRDDCGLFGVAATEYSGPPDRVRAPCSAPSASGGPEWRRPRDRGTGGTRNGDQPRTLPEPTGAIGQALGRMQSVDHSFDPAAFLDGAEKAFGIIVTAFAAGDRTTLQGLLSEDTWRAFEQAIAMREASGQAQVITIHAIHSATIENAELRGQVASITVRFISDQTSITRDKDGHPVAGTDAMTEITDLWTFERNLSMRDPVWRLVSARSA